MRRSFLPERRRAARVPPYLRGPAFFAGPWKGPIHSFIYAALDRVENRAENRAENQRFPLAAFSWV